MQNKKLKLFVWDSDNVLRDYTQGMICVLAKDFGQAIKLIQKQCPHCIGNFPINDYKVITKPSAFICWGGG